MLPLTVSRNGLTAPTVGGFQAIVNQYWVAYITTILFSVLFVLEVLFLSETRYPRTHILDIERHKIDGSSARDSWGAVPIRRTKRLCWLASIPPDPRELLLTC